MLCSEGDGYLMHDTYPGDNAHCLKVPTPLAGEIRPPVAKAREPSPEIGSFYVCGRDGRVWGETCDLSMLLFRPVQNAMWGGTCGIRCRIGRLTIEGQRCKIIIVGSAVFDIFLYSAVLRVVHRAKCTDASRNTDSEQVDLLGCSLNIGIPC